MTKPLYFGCWQTVGHNFYEAGMRLHVPLMPVAPTPWGYGVERLTPKDTTEQNAAALWQKDGWTALAVHDYSVDHRPGSKSVFCFPEHIITIEQAWERAIEVFPQIAARLDVARLRA